MQFNMSIGEFSGTLCKPVINCVCKDRRDKIEVADTGVKDAISKIIVEQLI